MIGGNAYSNHRGISLLGVVEKVHGRTVIDRIMGRTIKLTSEKQGEFGSWKREGVLTNIHPKVGSRKGNGKIHEPICHCY